MARIRGSAGTTRGFLKAVNQWVKETDERMDNAFQNISLTFYYRMRDATPVDTGNLRDSLVAYVNSQGQPVTVTGPNSETVRSGESQSIGNILNLKVGDKVSYVYNATYARRLNYGFTGFDSLGRYYNQPGRFWIEQVGSQYRTIAREVATQLKVQFK